LEKTITCGVTGDGLYIDINTGTATGAINVDWLEIHYIGDAGLPDDNC